MKTLVVVCMLVMCSCAFATSPKQKLVDSFCIGLESGVSFWGWPDYQGAWAWWYPENCEYPSAAGFRCWVTPMSNGEPTGVGGILFESFKSYWNDDRNGCQGGSHIKPIGTTKGKTLATGIGYVMPSFSFSPTANNAEAHYEISVVGRNEAALLTVVFWAFPAWTMWEQYGIVWRSPGEVLQPSYNNMAISTDEPEIFEMIEQNAMTNEIWKIKKGDTNSVVDSIVALPSVDVNGFENVATPYYVEFEVDTTAPRIKRVLMGSHESYGIYAYKVSGNTYRTEYIVPVQYLDQTRLYIDPNGVAYNFVHTEDVFTIENLDDTQTMTLIYRLFEEWMTGYTRSDINWDGVVNFKDYAILAGRIGGVTSTGLHDFFAHWLEAGGDFDFDKSGRVDFKDYAILTRNMN